MGEKGMGKGRECFPKLIKQNENQYFFFQSELVHFSRFIKDSMC